MPPDCCGEIGDWRTLGRIITVGSKFTVSDLFENPSWTFLYSCGNFLSIPAVSKAAETCSGPLQMEWQCAKQQGISWKNPKYTQFEKKLVSSHYSLRPGTWDAMELLRIEYRPCLDWRLATWCRGFWERQLGPFKLTSGKITARIFKISGYMLAIHDHNESFLTHTVFK